MYVEEELTVDEATGEVLLGGDLLRNRSFEDLMDAAIFRGVDVSNIKNAIDCERAIKAYFIHRLCNGKPLAQTTWRPPKRMKVETPPNHRIVTVSRWESSVSSLEDSV